MSKKRGVSRVSSNVLELDDISRLKEKEGYDEAEVRIETGKEGLSRSKPAAESKPGHWLKAAVLIIAVLLLSVVAVVYLPRLRLDVANRGFVYSERNPSADFNTLSGRNVLSSGFSIVSPVVWDFNGGLMSCQINMSRGAAGATTLVLDVHNLEGVGVKSDGFDCQKQEAYFECPVDEHASSVQLEAAGRVSGNSIKIMVFERSGSELLLKAELAKALTKGG